MKQVPQSTDLRAALASVTVKNRIRMCGSPAVPNISVRPSEIDSIGLGRAPIGAIDFMMESCAGWMRTASANRAPGLKLKCAITRNAIRVAPPSSSAALMICTQVVAFMPPKVT